jgi:hypothetical protein
LQAAAGGRGRGGDPAVRWYFMTLVPSQNRHRDIAILNETTAVQSAIEPIAHARRLIHPFGVGSMP